MVEPGHPKSLIELADTACKAIDSWFQSRVSAGEQFPIAGNVLIIDHYETSDIQNIVLSNVVAR